MELVNNTGKDIREVQCSSVRVLEGSFVVDEIRDVEFREGFVIKSGWSWEKKAFLENISSHLDYETIEISGCTWVIDNNDAGNGNNQIG